MEQSKVPKNKGNNRCKNSQIIDGFLNCPNGTARKFELKEKRKAFFGSYQIKDRVVVDKIGLIRFCVLSLLSNKKDL